MTSAIRVRILLVLRRGPAAAPGQAAASGLNYPVYNLNHSGWHERPSRSGLQVFGSSEGYMPLAACQVAYAMMPRSHRRRVQCLSFKSRSLLFPVTDSKHFNPKLSLGRPWLPGKLSLGGPGLNARSPRLSITWVGPGDIVCEIV